MIKSNFKKILFLCCILISFNSLGAECVGLKKCTLAYSILSNKEVEFDKAINFDTVSLAIESADLVANNHEKTFLEFMSKNLFHLDPYKEGKVKISNLRKGVYLVSPIFLVTKGDIPPMFSKEGPVTLVYKTNKKFKDLRGWGINRKLSSENLIEIESENIVAISDTYEKASEIMNLIFSQDKE